MPGVIFTGLQSTATTTDVLLEVLESLHKTYGHGVVEDAFTKDESVQIDVDVEIIEDGENCYRIGGRNEGSKM